MLKKVTLTDKFKKIFIIQNKSNRPLVRSMGLIQRFLRAKQNYTFLKRLRAWMVGVSLPQPNSTQPRDGLALFSYAKPQPQPQTKPYPTLSQLLHNQTRPNSVYNLISTQLEDS